MLIVTEAQAEETRADTVSLAASPHDFQSTWTSTPDRAFWWGICPLLAAISVAKAIRLPNYKSATQAQVDYSLGLIKRGMFGAVFSRPLHLEQYSRFVVFSWVLLLGTVALLLVFAWRSGARKRLLSPEILALFFSSYALVYMAHMVGYFEVVLLLVTVALLFLRSFWIRLACAVPAVVFALAVHEMFLFVFLPVLLFSFLLQGLAGARPPLSKPLTLGAVGLLIVVSLGTTVRLALKPPMTPAQLKLLSAHLGSLVDFPTNSEMYDVLVRSTRDNLYIMRDVAARLPWWRQQLVCLLTMAPTVILLLLVTRRLLVPRAHRSPKQPPGWLWTSAVLASLSPLAMHLLGFDVARFNAMVILTSFLVLLTVCRFTEGPPVALSPRLHRAVLLVMLLNMSSGDLLMDGRTVRPFPFIRELPQTLALRHGHWQPPDPAYKPRY